MIYNISYVIAIYIYVIIHRFALIHDVSESWPSFCHFSFLFLVASPDFPQLCWPRGHGRVLLVTLPGGRAGPKSAMATPGQLQMFNKLEVGSQGC